MKSSPPPPIPGNDIVMSINVLFLRSFQAMPPPDKLFKDKHVEFPLFAQEIAKRLTKLLLAERAKPFLKVIAIVKALVDLISTCNVLDVICPQFISAVLYFLQEDVLLHSGNEYSSRKYARLYCRL